MPKLQKKLPEVINASMNAEIHPDYKKVDGVRSAENGIGNDELLVHRMYGAVNIDGTTYRVKTTMHEYSPDSGKSNSPHSYEVTKIELLEKQTAPGAQGAHSEIKTDYLGTANLLKGVEKSYDKGKKLLDESEDLTNTDANKHKQEQFDIINETNPMLDDYHRGIRKVEDVHTFDEAVNNADSDGAFGYGDFQLEDAQKALKKGKITIYSSKPFENGVFVSTSKEQSAEYAGGVGSKFYSMEVPFDKVAWIDADEGMLADTGKPTKASLVKKTKSVIDNTTDTVETQKGNGNDTATPENAVSSDGKDKAIKQIDKIFEKGKKYMSSPEGEDKDKYFKEARREVQELNKILHTLSNSEYVDLSKEKVGNDGRIRKQQGSERDDLSNETEAQQAATDAIMQTLKNSGVDVTVLEDDAEMPDEARRQAYVKSVNDKFNEELDEFDKGILNTDFSLGVPSDVLRTALGMPNTEISMTKKTLKDHLKKHNLSIDDIKGLVDAIQKPMMVYTWGEKAKSGIIINNITKDDGRKITVALKLERNGEKLDINEVASIHGKDLERLVKEMNTTKTEFGKDNLKWVDKEKALEWLNIAPPKGAAITVQELSSAAKIIKDFNNPIISDVKIHKQSVFHGSGNDFDAFDFSHMGEGEGAQAYGWGGYVTEVNGIGRNYAISSANTSSALFTYKGKLISSYSDNKIKDLFGVFFDGVSPDSSKERIKQEFDESIEYYSQKDDKYIKGLVDLARKINVEDIGCIESKNRNLYTVDIPDNDGTNYLKYTERVGEKTADKIGAYLEKLGFEKTDTVIPTFEKDGKKAVINSKATGADVYAELSDAFGSDKEASRVLNEAGFVGIEYPAQHTIGGRTDGAKNYVIFNEKDMKITDHVKFLKDGKGTVYGYTVGGKIYLSQKGLNPNTPIHEYTHLWASAMQRNNPKEWANIKSLLKGTPVWDEVVNDVNYQEIKDNEDEVASEVLSRISGRKNSKRVVDGMQKGIDEAKAKGDIFGMAEKISVLNNIKSAIHKFWNWVGKDLLHIHFKSVDEVADRVLYDMMEGTKLNAKDETNEIISKAKADGTYMKAPNGEPTKLNEKQWAQVRTKTFKEWFGDWEKAARIEKLKGSKPIEITGKEIEPSEDLKQYKKNALEYGKKLQGTYTNKDTGETVQLQRGRKNDGINEVLQHDYKDIEHLQSVAAIPQIIEDGIYITSEPNNDTEKNPRVKEYQYYVCGLKIGDIDYTVRSVIAVDNDGSRYYDHKLTNIEKGALINSFNGQSKSAAEKQSTSNVGFGTTPGTKPTTDNSFTTTGDAPLPSSVVGKDTKLFSILQTNSSKVVDENGEPIVTYHNTNNDFNVFDKKKVGSNTDNGMYGRGFYFGNLEHVGYGNKEMNLYLSVKNPFVWNKYTKRQLSDILEIDESWLNDDSGRVRLSASGANMFDVSSTLKKNGYDGVINAINNVWTEYVVFSPNQIKSATGNNGDFSSTNDDIRYQFIGEKGAANADKAEEATARLDSLQVARETEDVAREDQIFIYDGMQSNMGSRVEKRMADIGGEFSKMNLSEDEKKVADVFSGKKDNETISVSREDGEHNIVMRQGNENHAGTKHSLYRHYGTDTGVITADDVVKIPEIIKNGERTVKSNGMTEYKHAIDGVTYKVVTEKHGANEAFTDFYSNKKHQGEERKNTQLSARRYNDDVSMAAKVGEKSESATEKDKKLLDENEDLTNDSSNNEQKTWIKTNDMAKAAIEYAKKDVAVYHNYIRANSRFEQLVNYYGTTVKDGLFERSKKKEAMRNYLYGLIPNMKAGLEKQQKAKQELHGIMEAARKAEEAKAKAEEEHIALKDAEKEPYRKMNNKELDKFYMDAVKKNDTKTMRNIIDVIAQRNGYSDSMSGYQGAGAWIAPNGGSYPTTEERRNAVGEDAPDLNLDDMAQGYSNQPMDIFTNSKKYGQSSPEHIESARIINHAINEIQRTGKIPLVRMYRAVPNGINESSFRNGDWITPSRSYAQMHGNNRLGGKYRIIEQDVPANQIWWDGNDLNEYGFDDGRDYAYQNTKNNRKLNELITYDDNRNIIPPSKRFNKRKGDVRFRTSEELNNDKAKEINSLFNIELQQQIDGKLKEDHIYQLGNPGSILLESGIPDMPIELRAARLTKKSVQESHPFELKDMKNLPEAIQNPIMIFDSKSDPNSKVILTELSDGENNYVAAIKAQYKFVVGRDVLEVNEIRSIYPKEKENIVSWISRDGLLRWADKNKAVNWLGIRQSNSADDAIPDNSLTAAKIIKDFENPTISEGKIKSSAERLGASLNTPIKFVGKEYIKGDDEQSVGKRNSKGWYDPKTGEVVLVPENNVDETDAERTVLHEVVAHKGLRELFGKHFDTFLYNVYANATKGLRDKINNLAAQKGWDIPLATEEYMAKLAENTEFADAEETGWWSKIRNFFIDMLSQAGVILKKKITDNELRYILWKSYKHLSEPNQYAPINVAEDTVMQKNLGVGRFKEDKLFSDGDPIEKERASVRDSYEREIASNMYQFQESMQDSMLGLKVLMDKINKVNGHETADYENAYMTEN